MRQQAKSRPDAKLWEGNKPEVKTGLAMALPGFPMPHPLGFSRDGTSEKGRHAMPLARDIINVFAPQAQETEVFDALDGRRYRCHCIAPSSLD
jgi:hypothetical protein